MSHAIRAGISSVASICGGSALGGEPRNPCRDFFRSLHLRRFRPGGEPRNPRGDFFRQAVFPCRSAPSPAAHAVKYSISSGAACNFAAPPSHRQRWHCYVPLPIGLTEYFRAFLICHRAGIRVEQSPLHGAGASRQDHGLLLLKSKIAHF